MPGPSDSRRRDDSRSPRRDRDSSSYHRRRSPNRPNSGRPSKPQDIGWGDSNKVGEREKDARYDRGSDRDDRGSYRSSSRRDREGSYGEKERVSERAKDRKRYDDDVKKEVCPTSLHQTELIKSSIGSRSATCRTRETKL